MRISAEAAERSANWPIMSTTSALPVCPVPGCDIPRNGYHGGRANERERICVQSLKPG